MSDEPERRTDNQFEHLKLVLGFFPRADAKTQFLTGLAVAMLGFLAPTVLVSNKVSYIVMIVAALAAALLLASLIKLYLASYPNLKGGEASLIYFNEIAKLRESHFIEQMSRVSEQDLFNDLAAQTWRNSEILAEKFSSLKHAHRLLILAVFPWIASILMAMVVKQFPQIHIP